MDVSRETLERLQAFEALVRQWNPAINLVSKGTLANFWSRHIVDSVQLLGFGPPAGLWVDLGSGGGFPGLVVAIVAAEQAPDLSVVLVESDRRKATFLRRAAQMICPNVTVCNDRIESLPAFGADALSARALAPLPDLLGHASRHLASHGTAIFPKGARFAAEIEAARQSWAFDVDTHPSLSDPDAAILVIRNIQSAKN